MNLRLLSLLLVTVCVLAGCSKKENYSRTDEVRTIPAASVYPRHYQFSQTWHNTENGGAALRSAAYEHALVSPYARKDDFFIRNPVKNKAKQRKRGSVRTAKVKALKRGNAVLAKDTQPLKPGKVAVHRKIKKKEALACTCAEEKQEISRVVKTETAAGSRQESRAETKSAVIQKDGLKTGVN